MNEELPKIEERGIKELKINLEKVDSEIERMKTENQIVKFYLTVVNAGGVAFGDKNISNDVERLS